MRRPYYLGAPQLIDDLAGPPAYGPGYAPHPMMPPRGGYAPLGYGQASGAPQGVPYRRIMPQVPGAPALGFRDQVMGLGTSQFNATSGTSLSLDGSPQRPFKGRRLVVDVTRTGTSATGLLSISAFDIGDVNQLVGRKPILVAGFAATAFGVDMQLSACAPALTVVLTFAISAAPTMTDTVDFGAQIHGETIGS